MTRTLGRASHLQELSIVVADIESSALAALGLVVHAPSECFPILHLDDCGGLEPHRSERSLGSLDGLSLLDLLSPLSSP